MRRIARSLPLLLASIALSVFPGRAQSLEAGRTTPAQATPAPPDPRQPLRFEITFPDSVRATPAKGRLLIFVSSQSGAEPRKADYYRLGPVYAVPISEMRPGVPITVDAASFHAPTALAFPYPLAWLPPGDYEVQALLDLDETQPDYNEGPGNLYSRPSRCELRGAYGGTWRLELGQVVPPATPPPDTEWVKAFDLPSARLSAFHGRPIRLRAAVILPPAYANTPSRRYPVIYQIPGYGDDHREAWGWISGPEGQRWRRGETALPAIRVLLDPSCRLGHHAFANSANNGPVGDALIEELIPEVERRFRAIPEPGARFLTGHSSGGWSSLWLQITYPDSFGGCWSLAPDPVDFRAFQTLDLYHARNGLWAESGQPRALMRTRTQVVLNVPELQLWEHVVGYGSQLDSFDAVFGPRRPDGTPAPVMDKLSGSIDPAVVEHWKRYDIRLVLEQNWAALAPKLKNKLHVIGAAWDDFYLGQATELLGEFLRDTEHGGYVEMLPGGHGSVLTPELARRIESEMAEAFARRANP